MNDVRPPVRAAQEIARAREIVARHELPDFITGFEIELGEMEGEPALYVVYSAAPFDGAPGQDEILRRAEAYGQIDHVILTELLHAFEDRLPYSKIVRADPSAG
ncbi:MAG: hypothetical protein RQ966_00210 [Acetobacteraceae bacterium]|nr:hypothetical protein [Acetobacteraceae bacterium]